MAIVDSSHTIGSEQIDGRKYVVETHADHVGGQYKVEYLAPVGADYVAIRTDRAQIIEQILAEIEANALL
jgi:hypothetical protein